MQSQDFIDMFEAEHKLWWYSGMREISAVLLDKFGEKRIENVLDIGCGTGINLKWLERYATSEKIKGLDIESVALKFCQERGNNFLIRASATSLPFADESFDLITNFDVLVQLIGEKADERAISEIFRILKPKGIAFIRVAAYKWMFSGHDKAINTQRRYNLNELSQMLEKAGFTILKKTYANTLLFPVAFFKRVILQSIGIGKKESEVKLMPRSLEWLNWTLKQPLVMEARFLKSGKRSLPFGLSAICIVQKN